MKKESALKAIDGFQKFEGQNGEVLIREGKGSDALVIAGMKTFKAVSTVQSHTVKIKGKLGSFVSVETIRNLIEGMESVEVVSTKNEVKTEKKIEKTNEMRCPKCESINIQMLGKNRKAFSVGKAVGGAVLTGGVGAMAGFIGKKNGYDCSCADCGNRFIVK